MTLFSKVYHTHTEKTVPYEKTVIEKRAPTDDSIRLAKEFEEKAQERLIQSFKLEPNNLELGVHGNIFVFQGHNFNRHLNYVVEFKLNEKNFKFDFKVDAFKIKSSNPMEVDKKLLKKVYENISNAITLELIKNTGTKVIGLSKDYKL